MKSNLQMLKSITVVTATIVSALSFTMSAAIAEYPDRPIKLIIPFGAGGNTDTTARIFQKAFADHNLLKQPLTVINVPGAGGSIGARQVKDAAPDGYTFLLYHIAMLSREASGASNFGYRDFAHVAGTVNSCHVTVVKKSNKISSYKGLLEAGKAKPDSLLFGVNLGANTHMIGLMMEQDMPGTKFRFVQVGGQAKAIAALKGGIVDIAALSVGGYDKFSSEFRGLALLADDERSDFPSLSTARKLGYKTSFCVEQYWLAPKGTPASAIQHVENAIKMALQKPEVRKAFEAKKALPSFTSSADLSRSLPALYKTISPIAELAKKK